MSVATTRTPYGLGSQNPTKKLAHHVYLLGQPLSRNRVFEIFRGEPPPLKTRLRSLSTILTLRAAGPSMEIQLTDEVRATSW